MVVRQSLNRDSRGNAFAQKWEKRLRDAEVAEAPKVNN